MTPTLYVFTISHYCEKAKWVLEYLGIEHRVKVISPLSHTKRAQALGLKRGSVPFLQIGEGVAIQGSNNIALWAEQNAPNGRSLRVEDKELSEIETRLDSVLGVHVRRCYYSEAICEHPHLVKPIFLHRLSLFERLSFPLAWGRVQQLMTKFMDLGQEQGEESIAIIDQELDWLESVRNKDSQYLMGDAPTIIDISVASLLAPLMLPENYPTTALTRLPPLLNERVKDWEQHPVWRAAENLYATLR